MQLVGDADLRHLGRTLAQQLASDGELVVDVPAKLAARMRLLSTGHGRKSEPPHQDGRDEPSGRRSIPGGPGHEGVC